MVDKIRKSELFTMGWIFIFISLLLAPYFESQGKSQGNRLLFLLSDVARVIILAGVACVIIGYLRNQRYRREAYGDLQLKMKAPKADEVEPPKLPPPIPTRDEE